MKLKKNILVTLINKEAINENNYKLFEVCEKCRNKYLGKYDNNGNCITWKKISYGNCYCEFVRLT